MLRITGALIVGLTCPLVAGGVTRQGGFAESTMYGIPGATDQEINEIRPALDLDGRDQLGEFVVYSRVIRDHPANRIARLFRVRLLIEAGALDVAENELLYLRFNHPNLPGVLEAEARIAEVLNDRKRTVSAYWALSRRLRSDQTFGGLATALARQCENRAIDAEGRPEEAIATIRQDASRAGIDPDWDEVARIELRRGHYAEASKAFAEAYASSKDVPACAAIAEEAASQLALSLWANGRASEAFNTALQAARISSTRNSSSELSGVALLEASFLSRHGSGTASERAEIQSLLTSIGVDYAECNPNSLRGVIPHLIDLSKRAGETRRLARILHRAPKLDWALWGALFFALEDRDSASGLAPFLPVGSVQRRLLEVGGAGNQQTATESGPENGAGKR